MNALLQELQLILECKVELVGSNQLKPNKNQTIINGSNHMNLLVHRTLNPVETGLIQRLVESSSNLNPLGKLNILSDPNGYKSNDRSFKYPLRLWRILYRDSKEEVAEILKSSFRKDDIIHMNNNESVVIVTTDEITPYELLGVLESEALTSVKIIISSSIAHPCDLHKGYIDTIELSELGKHIKEKAQIIKYEEMLFPMFVSQLRRAEGLNLNSVAVGDSELELTAMVFLENNLNITETANKLFIHRNTLIYRLNKLENITGYDIRKFNDAINYYLSYLADQIK
ncbi:MAG: helix-turn-helix domain-containing protein [Clostridia bacterium]|nr:helix-turn-helix domain-containing protein [Clostridia bacterium]